MIIGQSYPSFMFQGQGTVSITATSGVVAGVGTAFLSNFSIGDVLIVNLQSQVVISISSDTVMDTTVWSISATASIYTIEKLLEHSDFKPILLAPDFIEHDSILTGKRNFVNTHNYSDLSLTLYLWKYTDPVAKVNSLISFDGAIVNFNPYSEFSSQQTQSGLLKDDGSALDFYLSITFGYLRKITAYDIATLTFTCLERSTVVIDLKGYGTKFGEGLGGGGLYGL